MGEIRPFTEEFAEDAAALYFRVMRGQTRPPGETLPKYFCQMLIDNPWASSETPSLVYLENGKLVGTLGVIPRTMEFRGRRILVVTTTQFMVDPEYRRSFAALELLRRCFQGPQDMSWTDGAGEAVGGVWTAAGGRTAPLYSFHWARVLHPLGSARSLLDRAGGSWRLLKGASAVVTVPGDYLLSKLPFGAFRLPASPYSSRLVSAEELFACIQEIGWREPLKPAYELPSFRWMMSEVAKAHSLGELRMTTVQDPKGVRCGWFAYCAKPGGTAYVLQIGVRRRDQFDSTLLALFRDAWQAGCIVVKGQSIPQFLTKLTEQFCLFRHASSAALVQSRDPDLLNTVRAGEAALTFLDGESWLRFSSEDWA